MNNDKLTIILLSGALTRLAMLEVKASFNVEINNYSIITFGDNIITKTYEGNVTAPRQDQALVLLPKRKYKQKTRRNVPFNAQINQLNMFGYVFEENVVKLPVKEGK